MADYFENIIGHRAVRSVLSQSLESGRVAGAYLFSGPSGVGKATLAREFARTLNCEGSPRGAAECSCRGCTLFRSGGHPDYFTLHPEGRDVKIDQVRRLIDSLQLKPYIGKYKPVLVDPADALNLQASNALLKTLEEPPPGAVILLVTSMPHRLLITIRSRCQRHNFNALGLGEAAAVISARSSVGPEKARTMARISGGRPGKALAAELDDGALLRDTLELAERLDRMSSADILDAAAKLARKESARKGDQASLLEPMMELLMIFCREMALESLGIENDGLLERGEAGARAPADASAGKWIDRFQRAADAGEALKTYANRELLLDDLLFSLQQR